MSYPKLYGQYKKSSYGQIYFYSAIGGLFLLSVFNGPVHMPLEGFFNIEINTFHPVIALIISDIPS